MNDTKHLPALREVARDLGASGYFNVRKPEEAFAQVLAGHELGLPPFAAMSQIHIVKGKATIGATALAALVKRSGRYTYRTVRHDDEACVLAFLELVGGEWTPIGESSFTMLDAKRAGLTSNPTWQKFPRNMLFARAVSNGVRWHCPDLTHGAVYHHGELDDVPTTTRTVEVIDVEPALEGHLATFLDSARRAATRRGCTVKEVCDEVARAEGCEIRQIAPQRLESIAMALDTNTRSQTREEDAQQATARKEPTPTQRKAANARLHGTITKVAKLAGGDDHAQIAALSKSLRGVCHAIARELSGVAQSADWLTVDVDAMNAVAARLVEVGSELAKIDPADRPADLFDTIDAWLHEVRDAA